MTLPVTGPISLGDVNVELGRAFGAPISLQETAVRNLAGIPSGPISLNDLRGKSAFSVTANSVFGSGIAPPNPSTVVSNIPNTTPVSGTAPYTYSWTYVSGDATPTPSSPTAQNPTWSALVLVGSPRSAVWRVTVTDANSNTATADITVFLELI